MSWDTAHCIEDMLHIINPEHYKHLKDIPTKTFQNNNYSYNKFQYALEMYIKDQKLNASDLKEIFEASPNIEEKCNQLVDKMIEISDWWSVRAYHQIKNADKIELVRNSLLDLIETPAETFDLKVFNSDSEYREKFAEMFYEKTGIQLKERRFWEYYNNSTIDGENKS